jgi:Ca-activated chloride channel family protein
MLVATPGTSLKRIKDGTDWTFILDTSGSMAGQKINALRNGVVKAIEGMSPNDRFRIVQFSSHANEYTNGYVTATSEHIRDAVEKVKNLNAQGSTALYEGLSMGYRGLAPKRTTGVVLVTDGEANVGPTDHATMIRLLKEHDYRLFIFIIGNSANSPLLDALAKNSGGFSMNISSSDDIEGRLIQTKAKVLHECLYDAELTVHGGSVKDLIHPDLRNLYMGQQLVLFGKYASPGEVTVEIKGKIGTETKRWTCKAILPEKDTRNPEIERLWALSAIDESMEKIRLAGEDQSGSLVRKVTDLGTSYSLVTDYTAMVVVDESEMENLGIDRKNASRVNSEREAQRIKESKPAEDYRVDNRSYSSGSFFGGSSHSVGSGPVGPLFLLAAFRMRRRGKEN